MARSRGRRKLVAVILSIVILLAVLVIGDRVAAGVAENAIGDLIAEQAADNGVTSSQPPDVDITGFPFITQVLGGNYSRIDITLTDVGDETVSVPKLDIRAMDVSASLSDVINGSGPITAGRIEADGHISYDSLAAGMSDLIDARVTHDSGNTLTVEATIDVAGQPVAITGQATIGFADGALTISVAGFQPVDDTSGLPPIVNDVIADAASQFSRTIPMPRLPYDLTFAEPRFGTDAIVISASAQNVPLT